jgi:uncharacterized protein (DUF433 family)
MAAAMALKPAEYPHIAKTPGVCGGQARIDGTRISVMDVVLLYKWGMKLDEMREYYSDRPLTLAELHAALAYYYDHNDEIEAEIAADAGRQERHERAKAEYLARHPAR